MLSISTNSRFVHWASQQASRVENTLTRLSSGLRINRAADDAAGLRIAEGMRAQSRGAAMAAQNIQVGLSMLQFATDGLQGVLPVLQHMRELSVQAINGTNSTTNRQAIQSELDNLRDLVPEAYLIAQNARVNYSDPSAANRVLTFQVGANQGETITVDFNNVRTVLGTLVIGLYGYTQLYNSQYKSILDSFMGGVAPPPSIPLNAAMPKQLDVSTQASASATLTFLDTSIRGITGQLAYLGGMTNDMQSAWNTVTNRGFEMSGAESRIRDADMAQEASQLAREQVLQHSAIAVVSQASFEPRTLMRLLYS